MLKLKTGKDVNIPSIKRIQEILVAIGDKEPSFVSSRDWIGGAETCFVIDELFQVSCYLHHISSTESISSRRKQMMDYFKSQGGLIAMGGDQDASSKLIAGVHVAADEGFWLLVVASWAWKFCSRAQSDRFLSRILTLLECREMQVSSSAEAMSSGCRRASSLPTHSTTCACRSCDNLQLKLFRQHSHSQFSITFHFLLLSFQVFFFNHQLDFKGLNDITKNIFWSLNTCQRLPSVS